MIHRGIATLALGLMTCFFLLSHFDPQFFLFHFYESLIYLAIVVMLFYLEDRWACVLGILAPAVWLFLIYVIGAFPGFLREVGLVFRSQRPDIAANLLGGIASILSLLMIAFCAIQWSREFAGQHRNWASFLKGLVVVGIYYGALAVWFLRFPPVGR